MRRFLPAPTSLANSSSAIENSFTLTVGKISQDTPLRSQAAQNRREVGPLVIPLEVGNGPPSHRRPHPPDHRLEAQSGLVLGPKLDLLGLRMSLPDLPPG